MQSSQNKKIKKILSKLPDKPGVYFFRDKYGKILYIGKATSIRDRVRSYFSKDIVHTRGPLIVKMLSEFSKVDHYVADSVLEALILEAHLIKKHYPEANILQKDDRSFNFVIITDEEFPRVLTLRGRELFMASLNHETESELPYKISHTFGPFTNGGQLREALKLIRRMFPFRDKCLPCMVSTKPGKLKSATSSLKATQCRPCFNSQIGLCPGVCAGTINKKDYAKIIKNIVLFFEGNKKQLVKNLEKQMLSFAKERNFERANITKRTIYSLNHIQDISLIKAEIRLGLDPIESDTVHHGEIVQHPMLNKINGGVRIESYDIAHMSGQNVVGVMTVVEDGEIKKYEYRKFRIKDNPGVNDTRALKEVLSRRLGHLEWRFPDLIVVDGGIAQKNVMEKVLKENKQNIPVVSVVKDERHKPKEILGDKRWLKFEREILLANAESHRYGIGYHRQIRGKLL